MVLICLQVSVEGHPVILWTVASVNKSISFAQLLENLRAESVSTFEQYVRSLQQCQLMQCSISTSQGPFNVIDKFLPLEVCVRACKLLCDTEWVEPATSTSTIAMRNAFDVLMQSQATLSWRDKLPQKTDSHKKKSLFNDLLDLFEEKGWTWVDGGNTLDKSFLSKLWDVPCRVLPKAC